MNDKPFDLNDRIRISAALSWASGELGTISRPPKQLVEVFPEWEEDYFRTLKTTKGDFRFYWVRFDKPLFDADGDGPIEQSEVNETYLEMAE